MTPFVSATLLAVTAAVGYYTLEKNRHLIEDLLLYPYQMVREGRYLRVLTHGFVHGSWLHLAVNLYVFYIFGFALEKRPEVGNTNFAIIYFGSLIISGLVSTWKKKDRPDYRSLGASGAISGLLFSFILFYPEAELLLFFIIPIDAWMFALLFLGGSYYAAKNNYFPRIDHEAHIWGALAGLFLTLVLIPNAANGFIRMFGG